MKFSPAKILITAAMIGLGLSGGMAMAAYAPDVGTALAAVVSGPSTNAQTNGGAHTDHLSIAATYLGTTTDDLRTKMQAGQTLAQIAAATSGKSRDGLVAALTTDAKAKIAAAQTAGTITADQATDLTNGLADKIANFADSNRPNGPRGR